MRITNNYSNPLNICGIEIAAGETGTVVDETWAKHKDNSVLQAWIKGKVIKVKKDAEDDAEDDAEGGGDDVTIVERAEALGIDIGKKGKKRLLKEIAEAEANGSGDENTGDENTGDENTGDENTGDENTGDENTGGVRLPTPPAGE